MHKIMRKNMVEID